MNHEIIETLKNEVHRRCSLPSNKFGMGCYYHIEAVVKNGSILAERYNADREIVTIAAWLHDIASVTDYSLYEQHHIHGARIARELLTELSYDPKKVSRVEDCIRNHRGSIETERMTAEEICVADADAVSHFDSVPSLLYLAYKIKGMDIIEGRDFVKSKLERSFSKLSQGSKKFYRDKYISVMSVLGD